jgi:phenylalanyl-tRNA synthetase beta chain
MPTVSVSHRDICKLLGRKISAEKLCERFSLLGIEVDEIVGDEIKLEVAHNRPDLLGPEGVARVLKGFLGIEIGLPKYKLHNSGVVVEVDDSTRSIRPYIVAGVVQEVKLTDENVAALMQIQDKLHDTLGRNRRRGSIGVYDLDKIKPPVRYITTLPEGLRFRPLDFDRELTPAQILREHPKGVQYGDLMRGWSRYPMLVDSAGVVLSMPPIVNSEDTRVTSSTKRLFIDVTGDDERTVNRILTIMTTNLAERGFDLLSVVIKYPARNVRTPNLRATKRRLRVSVANEFLGLNLKPKEVVALMKRMRFDVASAGEVLTVSIPPYRSDVMHEIDLVEDLAIAYGYNKLAPTIPNIVTVGEKHLIEKLSEKARAVMVGLGFMEVMTYTLTNPNVNFKLMRTSGEAATIANPISEEYTVVRNWLLPSLLSVLRANRRNPLPQRIFEVGDVVQLRPEAETGAVNVRKVAAAVIGGQANFTYIRAIAEALLGELGVTYEFRAIEHPSFIDGRAAEFLVKNKRIGIIGELHPEVILGFELEHPVAAFELDLLY